MSEEITPEVFAHLVHLAAIELDPTQAEYLRRELNNQLNAIHELAAIPLEADVPVASHGIPYSLESSPALRPDEWQPYANPAAILEQAPRFEGGYIIVPDIPHEELE